MASEKEPFVPTNNLKKPYEITIPPPNDYNKGKEKKKHCCACTCRCWCICCISCVFLVGCTLLIGYLVITSKLTGTATEEDATEWEEKLTNSGNTSAARTMTTSDMAGVYKLVSFTNLGPYLETLGIPSFVIPLIKGMSQVVTFETPDEPGGEWVMGTETDFGSKVERFELGVEAAVPYGKMLKNFISGVIYLTFTNPEPNMLRFVSEERRKGWKFESNLTFSPMGFMEERHFITKGVKMKKFFKRTNREEWEEEKRRKAAENPFGDVDDDAFSHDDDDFEGFMEEGDDDSDVPRA